MVCLARVGDKRRCEEWVYARVCNIVLMIASGNLSVIYLTTKMFLLMIANVVIVW